MQLVRQPFIQMIVRSSMKQPCKRHKRERIFNLKVAS